MQWGREGNGIPLQYSCLENPMDGGSWWAAVHGVAKSRTRLNDFTFTFHFHALEKETATHSSVLAWRIPGMGEPSGLPSMGSLRVGHDWSDLQYSTVMQWGAEYTSFILNSEGTLTKWLEQTLWSCVWISILYFLVIFLFSSSVKKKNGVNNRNTCPVGTFFFKTEGNNAHRLTSIASHTEQKLGKILLWLIVAVVMNDDVNRF